MFDLSEKIFGVDIWGRVFVGTITAIKEANKVLYYSIDGFEVDADTGEQLYIRKEQVAVYAKSAAKTLKQLRNNLTTEYNNNIELFFNSMKGDLNAILDFPLHEDVLNDAEARTAYRRAVLDYLNTLEGKENVRE